MFLFKKKYIFIHVPKCGGTSLTRLLKKTIPWCRMHPERFSNLDRYTNFNLKKYNFFSGHYVIAETDRIPAERKVMFTTFRDPIKRLISLYDFWRAHRPDIEINQNNREIQIASAMGFTDFLHCDELVGTAAIDNPFVRTFLDRESRQGPVKNLEDAEKTEMLQRDPEMCIDIALDNIRNLDGWFFLENAEAELSDFMRNIGFDGDYKLPREMSLPELIEQNPRFRPIEKTVPTDRQSQRIGELVHHDLVLTDRLRAWQ